MTSSDISYILRQSIIQLCGTILYAYLWSIHATVAFSSLVLLSLWMCWSIHFLLFLFPSGFISVLPYLLRYYFHIIGRYVMGAVLLGGHFGSDCFFLLSSITELLLSRVILENNVNIVTILCTMWRFYRLKIILDLILITYVSFYMHPTKYIYLYTYMLSLFMDYIML